MDIVTSQNSQVNEKPARWGLCPLEGAIPGWCPRRFDNSDTIIASIIHNADRYPNPWFVDMVHACYGCRLEIQERLGIDGLLSDFMRKHGIDIVASLDTGDISPHFTPKARQPAKRQIVTAKTVNPLPTPYRLKVKAVTR